MHPSRPLVIYYSTYNKMIFLLLSEQVVFNLVFNNAMKKTFIVAITFVIEVYFVIDNIKKVE